MEYAPNKFERDQYFKKFFFSIQKKLSEKNQMKNTEESEEGKFFHFFEEKIHLAYFFFNFSFNAF